MDTLQRHFNALIGRSHRDTDLTANGIYKFRIANQHTQAKTSHIIGFTQRVQFYSDFACTGYLKDTYRSVTIEIDFGIGHIMNNNKVIATGKCDNILEESTIRT